MQEKTKVISYIFRNSKRELLVFAHESFPEAGIQVVGGTVELGENLKAALIRELEEESGLIFKISDLASIGETTYHRKDPIEVNYRHYFEIQSSGLPDSWSHSVRSNGEDNGMIFNFFWLPILEAKKCLVGNLGELLNRLSD